MKLESIRVKNYRSIRETQVLTLDEHLTVILGPNNEGKSNLLRAIVLAMNCLRRFPSPFRRFSTASGGIFDARLPSDAYHWDADFPRSRQAHDPDGQTILSLTFRLTEGERQAFRQDCGNAVNGDLPLEIALGPDGFPQFTVRKPGRGHRAFEKNSRKIATFISKNFTFQYIPAIRPTESSLHVIQDLLGYALEDLSQEAKYKNAIKAIDELQEPVYARLETTVQEQLRKLLPTVKKVKISRPQGYRFQARFRSPELIIDDGTETKLEAKGDGVKSLAAISLMRASRAGRGIKNLVVAIEEPESHLHPDAIRKLATILREMAAEHQVIITTHSPLLAVRNRLQANVIVSKSKATPATSIKDIRSALGVQVGDNLTQAEYVILVEGKTDIKMLTALFSNMSELFSKFAQNGRVVFDDLNGAKNINYKISNLRSAVTTQIVITDDDKAGRQAYKDAGNAGLDQRCRYAWKRPSASFNSTELEDLVAPDFYWNDIEKKFGVKLDRERFDVSRDKWSERMKVAYEGGGKHWSASVENDMKSLIAELVSGAPVNALATECKGIVENVVAAVVDLIDNVNTTE